MTPCLSSLFFLSFFTLSNNSSSSSASRTAALALEWPLLANEKAKLVMKQIDMLLLVETGDGCLDSLTALHKFSCLLASYLSAKSSIFVVGKDEEDGVGWDGGVVERKEFVVDTNGAAISLSLRVFFFFWVFCFSSFLCWENQRY
uniref:Uncharacterized protein n=1 Tax=Rhizophora mucronata TaxID=61149 RepID=A0A2P2LHP7_RHIMU